MVQHEVAMPYIPHVDGTFPSPPPLNIHMIDTCSIKRGGVSDTHRVCGETRFAHALFAGKFFERVVDSSTNVP